MTKHEQRTIETFINNSLLKERDIIHCIIKSLFLELQFFHADSGTLQTEINHSLKRAKTDLSLQKHKLNVFINGSFSVNLRGDEKLEI